MNLHELMAGVTTRNALPDIPVTGMTSDSRNVQPGFCFVAIAGGKADGHDYVKQAQLAGASLAVVQRPVDCDLPLDVVEDTRTAYSLMAANHYGNPARKLKLAGVTGTNGKTSTTFILKHVLESEGHKVGLIGTIVSIIGDVEEEADNTTPDAMHLQSLFARMVEAGCDWCVMEVSSHALDQHRVEGLHFACAIFTNLTQDHLDYHGDMETYRLAKQKLFDHADIGVFNYDDPACAAMMAQSKAPVNLSFSIQEDAADVTAKNVTLSSTGIEYQAVAKGAINRISLAMLGGFNVYNTLGVLTAATALGIPQQNVAVALRSCKGVKGRIEMVQADVPYTIVLDYAHTPDALRNIGRALTSIATGGIITVYGCGGDRDRTKRPLMTKAVLEFSSYFVLTSDNPRSEDPQRIVDDAYAGAEGTEIPHEVIVDRTQAIAHALRQAKPGDIVLIAGKGHETYQILSTGKIHYDEREVVRDLLSAMRD